MQNPIPEPDLPDAAESADQLPDRVSAFHSALLTEHFVLESARGITVSESSSRASIYLMTLSSSLVAFGFLASSEYGLVFLGVMLPIVFVLGVFTYQRLVETSLEDVAALESIQKIRRYYSTLLPGAEKFFPMPQGPHAPNEMLFVARRASWRGVFFTMSTAIAVINCVVGGTAVTLGSVAFGLAVGFSIGIGAAVGIIFLLLHGLYQERQYALLGRNAAGSWEK